MARLTERLARGELAITLEITPPKKRLEEVLLRRARLLGGLPDAIHVIQRPDRMSSLDASLLLAERDFEPVWHLVNRGRTGAEIASEIESARSAGLELALCLRGDHEAADRPDALRIRELIAAVGHAIPSALLGATANQHGPRDRVLANLRPKLDAGARFVQTHPVFDTDRFLGLASEVHRGHPDVHLVAMIMPLTSVESALRIQQRLGLPIPEEALARLRAGGEPAGWSLFAETVERLLASGRVSGLAVMTPEMDPPEPTAQRLVQVLGSVRR